MEGGNPGTVRIQALVTGWHHRTETGHTEARHIEVKVLLGTPGE